MATVPQKMSFAPNICLPIRDSEFYVYASMLMWALHIQHAICTVLHLPSCKQSTRRLTGGKKLFTQRQRGNIGLGSKARAKLWIFCHCPWCPEIVFAAREKAGHCFVGTRDIIHPLQ